jgi:hypothetical protein
VQTMIELCSKNYKEREIVLNFPGMKKHNPSEKGHMN